MRAEAAPPDLLRTLPPFMPRADAAPLLAWEDAKCPGARSARRLPGRRKGSSKPARDEAGLLAGTDLPEAGINEKPRSFRKRRNESAWVDSLPLPQCDRGFAVCSSGVPVLAISLLRQPDAARLLPEACPATHGLW